MRAPGEVRQALLSAACELATPERGATLLELAQHAKVGRDVARDTVANMKRSGALTVPRVRRVPYRNRPVSEYAPAAPAGDGAGGAADDVLRDVMVMWVNR
jgi:hypothetical protein